MKGSSSRKITVVCATCGHKIPNRSQRRSDAICVECERKRAIERTKESSELKVNILGVLERRKNRYLNVIKKIDEQILKTKNEQ